MIEYEKLGMKYNYGWSKEHAQRVASFSLQLRKELVKLNLLSPLHSDEYVLTVAGYLHDIGRNSSAIGTGKHNERSYETLKQELEPEELTKDETMMILDCVLFHTGRHWETWQKMEPKRSKHGMKLAAIFRIVDGLDRGLPSAPIKEVYLKKADNKIICEVVPASNTESNQNNEFINHPVIEKAKLFREIFNLDISFEVSEC